MIEFLKKLFCTRKEGDRNSTKPLSEYAVIDSDFEWHLKKEIDNCKFIKKECHTLILDHFLKKKDILRTQNKLSVEEKKILGINTRLSITKELIEVLNEDGIKSYNPKAIISNLFYRATHAKCRRDQMKKIREVSSIEKIILKRSGGGSGDCDWCIENQNIEHSVNKEIEILIEENCRCDPYCYCYIEPIWKDFK